MRGPFRLLHTLNRTSPGKEEKNEYPLFLFPLGGSRLPDLHLLIGKSFNQILNRLGQKERRGIYRDPSLSWRTFIPKKKKKLDRIALTVLFLLALPGSVNSLY